MAENPRPPEGGHSHGGGRHGSGHGGRHPLKGSERKPLDGAKAVGKADPAERLQVSMMLRSRDSAGLTEFIKKLEKQQGGHLSSEDFAQRFGTTSADIAKVKKFATAHRLKVVEEHAGRRTVVLSGTVAQFDAAFGVELQRFKFPGGSYRGYLGPVQLEDELHGVVEAVLGLDSRPAAKPNFRVLQSPGSTAPTRQEPHARGPQTPLQIAGFYGIGKGVFSGTGQGECVAILEFGGGPNFDDLANYFSGLGINPLPKVDIISVDGASTKPTGDLNGPDGEVMLDIEIVGAVAPAAHIVVYIAPNTEGSWINAVSTAIHDTNNRPSVISISWGGSEVNWAPATIAVLESQFQAATAIGITVCVASGDKGSTDGLAGDHVQFPASSPHVLACGGTQIFQNDVIDFVGEKVWNNDNGAATGGGVSTVFQLPDYQSGKDPFKGPVMSSKGPLTMRGVPDVAGNADPESGWKVRIDGSDTVMGGTSAVAPLFAALIARINSEEPPRARVGFMNPTFYQNPEILTDITEGNNGSFQATRGWDACTGLGTPIGAKIHALLLPPISANTDA